MFSILYLPIPSTLTIARLQAQEGTKKIYSSPAALCLLYTSSQLQLYQHLLKPLLLIEGRPHNLAQCASLCQAGCGCEAGIELQTINR